MRRCNQDAQTYRRRDLGYNGKQEPDDTLVNEHRIGKVVSVTSSENRCDRTCVQSRRTKLEVPP
jgi:hypothetical protein